MYTIVQQGGKQYICSVNQVIKIEKINVAVGDEFTFPKVLLVNGNESKSATVKGKVLSQEKTDKVIVFKKKRRHNYRRKNGHRQNITIVRITEIKE
jgi:large subunit ribosomal protein L21